MKKSLFPEIIFLVIISILVFIGIQACSQNGQSNINQFSYAIDHITLNNKINGVAIEIQEAKILTYNPDYLDFTYTITNNTDQAINREAYEFTIRGYSKDGYILFEYTENWIFDSSELDPGKKVSNTSDQKIYSIKDKVYEIVIDFDKNMSYPGWW